MTRRRVWLAPLLFGAALALVAYAVTLAATPQLLMAAAERRLTALGGTNRFAHAPLATSAARTIVRPSPDLAYSSCAIDLSKGPVAITAMPVPAPYWSLSVFDARTNAVFVRNNGEARNRPIRIVLATARQSVPEGATVVRLSDVHAIALIRILVDDRGRYAAIDAARRQSVCGSL